MLTTVFMTLLIVGLVVLIGMVFVWSIHEEVKSAKAPGLQQVFEGMASETSELLHLSQDQLSVQSNLAITQASEHLQPLGYDFQGCYLTNFEHNPEFIMGLWEHMSGTVCCVYIKKKADKKVSPFFEIVSCFHYHPEVVLTTSATPDGSAMPQRAGRFTEYFPGSSLDELLVLHAKSVDFFSQRSGLEIVQTQEPIPELILRCVREDARFIMSIPNWKIRSLIWFFKRKQLSDIPISNRYGLNLEAHLPELPEHGLRVHHDNH